MGKTAAVISQVASVVATVAMFIPGGQIVAAAASAVALASSVVASQTMKKPELKGSVSQIVIGMNMPLPYSVGRTSFGGMRVYDKSANGPNNFDRTQIQVLSAAAPIEEFQALQADFKTINFSGADWNVSRVATGFYGADGGYLWLNTRMGLRPDTALTQFAGRSAFAEWGADYKLSGYAAYSVTMEFDEDGERWASGVPQFGMIGKWVWVYDPRLDDTYPGGAGDQRWDDELSWAWTDNPGLHALTYVRGRYIEKDAAGVALATPVPILGCHIPQASIDVAAFVELANICEANGWTLGGTVFEGHGFSKWDNLKRFLQAAAAQPVWSGGTLTLRISAPKVALDTIKLEDLAEGDVEIQAMKSWQARRNTIVARFRSEEHRWEYVQSDAVTNATYLTEDGEIRSEEIQFDLVQDKDQAAQLAAYELVNAREFGPITLTVKPRLMSFRPGEALELDIPEGGLEAQLAVITRRSPPDPITGAIRLTLESETTAKHAFALGQTGTAPPTPTIFGADDLDDAVSGNGEVPPDPATITLVDWGDRLIMRTDPIPRAKNYRWRFYLSDGTTLRRELTTAAPQVEYTKAQAHSDGISRSYKVQVAGVNDAGPSTTPLMSATQTKAAPAAPTAVAFADGTSTSQVTFTPPGGQAGILIAYSTTTGFNPMTQGASFFAISSPAFTPQIPAASYFGKAAAYDLWSSQPDQLNFSAQDAFTITPGSGGDPAGGGGGGGFEGGGGGGDRNIN